jgi:hypothetical protein
VVAAPSHIGLLGDVHADDEALDVAMRFLADAGVDPMEAVPLPPEDGG